MSLKKKKKIFTIRNKIQMRLRRTNTSFSVLFEKLEVQITN